MLFSNCCKQPRLSPTAPALTARPCEALPAIGNQTCTLPPKSEAQSGAAVDCLKPQTHARGVTSRNSSGTTTSEKLQGFSDVVGVRTELHGQRPRTYQDTFAAKVSWYVMSDLHRRPPEVRPAEVQFLDRLLHLHGGKAGPPIEEIQDHRNRYYRPIN